jgi:hypothetical protein
MSMHLFLNHPTYRVLLACFLRKLNGNPRLVTGPADVNEKASRLLAIIASDGQLGGPCESPVSHLDGEPDSRAHYPWNDCSDYKESHTISS